LLFSILGFLIFAKTLVHAKYFEQRGTDARIAHP
jgi:hypothetical protein